MRIVLMSATPCRHEARPRFTAATLAAQGHDVTLLARAAPDLPAEDAVGAARLLRLEFDSLAPCIRGSRTVGFGYRLLLLYMGFLRAACGLLRLRTWNRLLERIQEFWLIALHAEAAVPEDVDIVHAVGLAALPAAGRIARRRGAALVYDSVELERDRNVSYHLLLQALRMRLERYWIRRAHGVSTVSPEVALQMARDHAVARPDVICNMCPERPPVPGLRADLGVGPDTPVIAYLGSVTMNRGVLPSIDALKRLPDYRLAIVGPILPGFEARVRAYAAEKGVANQVRILPARPPEEAAAYIAEADVGLALFEPGCASYVFALPNKLFQFVAAGAPILTGRTPTLRRFIAGFAIGKAADERSSEAVADAIRDLFEYSRTPAFRAARARFLARFGEAENAAGWARLHARAIARART